MTPESGSGEIDHSWAERLASGPGAEAASVAGFSPDIVFLPGRSSRLAAVLLDLAIPGALLASFVLLGSVAGLPPPTSPRLAVAFLLLTVAAAAVLSSVSSWLTGGQSIGKGILGLEVRRAGSTGWDDRLLTLAWAFGRSTVGYVLVDCLGLGAIGAAFGRHRRAAHDLAFASQVVAVDPSLFSEATTRRQLLSMRAHAFDVRRQAGLDTYRKKHGHLARTVRFASKIVGITATAYVAMLRLAAPSSAASSTSGSGAVGGSGVAAAPVGTASQVGLLAGGTALTVVVVTGVVPADAYGDLPEEGRVALFLASEGVESSSDGTIRAWVSTDGRVRLEPALGLPAPALRQGRSNRGDAIQFSIDGSSPEDGTTRALVGEAPPGLAQGSEDRTVIVATTSEAPFGGIGVGWGQGLGKVADHGVRSARARLLSAA